MLTLDVPTTFQNTSDLSVANALRRVCLTRLGSVAGGHVVIRRNDSVMSDEQLAHRIGMLAADGSRANDGDVLHLNVTASSGKQQLVLSSDIKRQDGEVVWAHDPVILIILGPNHAIDLDVVLKYASADVHTRFCPLETVQYMPQPHGGCRLGLHSTGARTDDEIVADLAKQMDIVVSAANAAVTAVIQ